MGAVASVATQVISNVTQGKNWSEGVASAAVVGAASGAIAATGLGVVAQATYTGVAAAAGDALQQGIDKGFDEIDPAQSIRTGLVAGATSLVGSYTGKKYFGGIEDLGNSYISKGHQKNLIGVTRALNGKSHTSYYRSGSALIAKGNNLVNVYRGVSSSFGSLIGTAFGLANNLIPK